MQAGAMQQAPAPLVPQAVGTSACNRGDACSSGSGGQGEGGETQKDEMLERARTRVGFRGLPAAFIFDKAAGVGIPRAADTSAGGGRGGGNGADASGDGSAGRACGDADGQEGTDQAGTDGDGAGAHGADGVSQDIAAAKVNSKAVHGRDIRSGSCGRKRSQEHSDDLDLPFCGGMPERMDGGDSYPCGKSGGGPRATEEGSVAGDGGTGQSETAWGTEWKGARLGEPQTRARDEISAAGGGSEGIARGTCDAAPGAEAGTSAPGDTACDAMSVRTCSHIDTAAGGGPDTAAGATAPSGAQSGKAVAGQAGQRAESREEGGVLHTFVAESQESLKSLRTLLNRSREGLRRGPREAALPQHARVSDHGDVQHQHAAWRANDAPGQDRPGSSGSCAEVAVAAESSAADVVARHSTWGGHGASWKDGDTGGVGGGWGDDGAVDSYRGRGMALVAVAEGGMLSEASSPARSLVALPAREVHTARANMLILQRQDSGDVGGGFDSPTGYEGSGVLLLSPDSLLHSVWLGAQEL